MKTTVILRALLVMVLIAATASVTYSQMCGNGTGSSGYYLRNECWWGDSCQYYGDGIMCRQEFCYQSSNNWTYYEQFCNNSFTCNGTFLQKCLSTICSAGCLL